MLGKLLSPEDRKEKTDNQIYYNIPINLENKKENDKMTNDKMTEQMLVEKYRPKEFKDIIGLPQDIEDLLPNIPHLLFKGVAGSGKTSCAKVIISKLCPNKGDYLILNSSDERGIDTVREKIKDFAKTKSISGKFKICLLDEGDKMTNAAVESLRHIIEAYSSNCRFIITGNYDTFSDAIKSRCTEFKFHKIPRDDIFERLKYICDQEKVKYDFNGIYALIDNCKSDMRKAINTIQRCRKVGVYTENLIPEEDGEQFWEFIQNKRFTSARALIRKCENYDTLLRQLFNAVIGTLKGMQCVKAVEIIADTSYRLNFVADKEMQLEAMVLRLFVGGKNGD